MFGRGMIYLLALFLAYSLSACNPGNERPSDTPRSGDIKISVDESFKPLIDEEISIFERLHELAKITADYKSENDAFKDLINDSVDLIITTRPLDTAEEKYFKENHDKVLSKAVARDAVTLIVNPSNADTLMTMKEVKELINGNENSSYEMVIDRANSSLVRFMIDSVNEGHDLGTNVKVAGGSEEVVDYVASHKNAVGVIGVSWVSDPYDSTGLSFLKKINVVGVMGDSTYNYLSLNDNFDPKDPAYRRYYYKPYQAYIAFKSYPMVRNVYFVLRQNYRGLATGFANFLGAEKGQMIIGKNRLFPLNMNIQLREAAIQ